MVRQLGFAFVLLLLSAMSARAQVPANAQGDDFDPANPPPGFWNTQGTCFYECMNAAGTVYWASIPCFLATTNLYATHDADPSGTTYAHWHTATDLQNVDPTHTYLDDANRYWDKRFDFPTHTTHVAGTNATVKTNCYAYAMATYCRGTWNYWLDQNGSAIPAAIRAVSTVAPTSQTQANDVLYYDNGTPIHATGVDAIVEVGTPQVLRWKNNASAIYTYNTNGFDTPMMTGPSSTPGAWVWDPAGLASSANLAPANSVCRPK